MTELQLTVFPRLSRHVIVVDSEVDCKRVEYRFIERNGRVLTWVIVLICTSRLTDLLLLHRLRLLWL